jgi:DNA-binding response OmpR family regulator
MDPRAWEHIVINLIGNAIKFTPDNGSIRFKFGENADQFFVLVIDSGYGISGEDLPHIFDTYYQGKNQYSKAEGTGIGLSLVHGLITRMNGEITARSEPNVGTEFHIKLQKGYQHFEKDDSISHTIMELPPIKELTNPIANSISETSKDSSIKSSILLVEDNDDFRDYISSVIQEFYEVKTASNGLEGLDMLKTYRPDIILSDIMMPHMDGIEMMKEIRSRKEFTHIPFIFLSAKDSERDIEMGLNNGADIYLTKPVQKRLLLTQIKALLRREERLNGSNAYRKLLSPFHQQILGIIERHMGNPDLNIELIAQSVSMSRATLYRKWKKESELTLNQLINKLRLEEAIRLIANENLNFSEASFVVGYTNLSYFSQAFKKVYGVSPQDYFAKL